MHIRQSSGTRQNKNGKTNSFFFTCKRLFPSSFKSILWKQLSIRLCASRPLIEGPVTDDKFPCVHSVVNPIWRPARDGHSMSGRPHSSLLFHSICQGLEIEKHDKLVERVLKLYVLWTLGYNEHYPP